MMMSKKFELSTWKHTETTWVRIHNLLHLKVYHVALPFCDVEENENEEENVKTLVNFNRLSLSVPFSLASRSVFGAGFGSSSFNIMLK